MKENQLCGKPRLTAMANISIKLPEVWPRLRMKLSSRSASLDAQSSGTDSQLHIKNRYDGTMVHVYNTTAQENWRVKVTLAIQQG